METANGRKIVKLAKVAAVLVVSATTLAIPAVAYASCSGTCNSYSSTFSFDTSLNGPTRYYNGSNVRITFSSSANGSQNGVANPYVELYRVNPVVDDYIGRQTFSYGGSVNKNWTGVGAGDYRFHYKKTFDGVWLTSSNVVMSAN
ncbi:hypothetical protein [Streptosporangium sp. NPDC006007]|uniref:hypothetical protein n=1 Tax=Streptosporangium sp. NPDC006007 TaxID=3154575 RepID=UPI00339E2CB5